MFDTGEQVIHAFTGAGVNERSFGREGLGPGEFRLASALAVSADTVIVHDAGSRKLVKFTTRGEFIADSSGPAGMAGAFAYSPGTMTYFIRGIRDSVRVTELVVAADSGYRTLIASPDTLTRSARYRSCGIIISLAPLFAPELKWAAAGERIVVSGRPDYSIEVYQLDSLVSILAARVSVARCFRAERALRIGGTRQPGRADRLNLLHHPPLSWVEAFWGTMRDGITGTRTEVRKPAHGPSDDLLGASRIPALPEDDHVRAS